jgi:hypothetical protein
LGYSLPLSHLQAKLVTSVTTIQRKSAVKTRILSHGASPLEGVGNSLTQASRCQVFFIMHNVSSTIAPFSYNLLINFLMFLKDILELWQ